MNLKAQFNTVNREVLVDKAVELFESGFRIFDGDGTPVRSVLDIYNAVDITSYSTNATLTAATQQVCELCGYAGVTPAIIVTGGEDKTIDYCPVCGTCDVPASVKAQIRGSSEQIDLSALSTKIISLQCDDKGVCTLR